MSTTPNASPSRSFLSKLVRAKKKFKLRIPGIGIMVAPVYDFQRNALQPGEFIGVATTQDNWFEIGQVVGEGWDGPSRSYAYYINLVDRLTSSHRVGLAATTIPAQRVSCVFKKVEQ